MIDERLKYFNIWNINGNKTVNQTQNLIKAEQA